MTNSNASRLQRCETQLQDFLAEALRGESLDSIANQTVAGKWSAHENLAHLARYHQVFLQRIEKLSEEDFERTGVHPKFGEMSLALWLEFFLVHEAHHLYVVLQLVRKIG